MVGAILIATDVIDVGDRPRRIVRQAPMSRPAANPIRGSGGKTVAEIYKQEGRGVVFIQAARRDRGGLVALRPAEQQQGTATGSGFLVDDEGTSSPTLTWWRARTT